MRFQQWQREWAAAAAGAARAGVGAHRAAGVAGCRRGAGERPPKNQEERGCAAPWFPRPWKGWRSVLEAGLGRRENRSELGLGLGGFPTCIPAAGGRRTRSAAARGAGSRGVPAAAAGLPGRPARATPRSPARGGSCSRSPGTPRRRLPAHRCVPRRGAGRCGAGQGRREASGEPAAGRSPGSWQLRRLGAVLSGIPRLA